MSTSTTPQIMRAEPDAGALVSLSMRKRALKCAGVLAGSYVAVCLLAVASAAQARQRLLREWNSLSREERAARFTDPLFSGAEARSPADIRGLLDDCREDEIPASWWCVDVLGPLSPYSVVPGDRGPSLVRWRLTVSGWRVEALYYLSGM